MRVTSRSSESDDSAADAAPQHSEPVFQLIFDSAPIGIALLDLQGRPSTANAALEHLLGYSEAELRTHAFIEFTFPDDATAECALFEELLAGTRAGYQIEKRFVRKNGALIWGSATVSMLRDATGAAKHCVCVVEDITARKRAEEDRARLEAIVESSSDAILSETLDGTITDWNPAAEQLYGYSAAEVVGRSFTLLVPSDLTDETPGLLEKIRRGERVTHFETARSHKDGRRLSLSLSLSPIRDASGLVIGAAVIAREIKQQWEQVAAVQRYQLLAEHTQDILLFLGPDLRILDCNAAALAAYGYDRAELLELSIPDLRAPGTLPPTREQMARASAGGLVFETIHQRKDGTTLAVEVSSVSADVGNRPVVLSIVRDITQRRATESDLAHHALHDHLTGLPNRAQLHSRLQHALGTGQDGRSPVALLLLDLDRFKEVNDTLGHRVGDILLHQIGERLQSAVRTADLVARLGGDEFAVVLPGVDATGAVRVADGIARVLEAPFGVEGQPIRVDVSIGIAVAPEHGHDDEHTLLRRADVAMYQAKRSGAGWALYSATDDEHSPDRLALLGQLQHAIDNDELLLHYQPKLNLRDGKLVGVEALVRWQHPQRGFLPPSEFIPMAEQSGLIGPLSRWVLDEALRQQHTWRSLRLNIPVAVNLSRRTLHDPHLSDSVAELLTRRDVSPSALVLEITESSLMADPIRAGDNLRQLHALGVRISIDDFGTGYSSLSSLKSLPVDELKIDQSFVQSMATDADSRAIVRAIIDLADALKLTVVAEGVEDRATCDVLAALGCDVAQGYFLSRPVAAAELEVWLRALSPKWLAGAADQSNLDDALQERIRGRGARLTAEEEFIARKRAEAALSASEERNRLALQAASMGTWDVDYIHNVHAWSSETEALFGLAPGTFASTFPSLKAAIHPEDWEAFQTEDLAARTEHRDSNVTFRAVWPDGSLHWLEEKGRPQYAADGTLVRMTGTTMDISHRKQAEAALRASEERTTAALQAASMGTWDWDVIHDVVTWSDETRALAGLAPGTFGGTLAAVQRTILPEDWPALLNEIQVAGVERGDWTSVYRTVWPNGSVHWLETKGRGLYSADGALQRVTGTTMDVSEREQADEGLRASEGRYRTLFDYAPDGILIADGQSYYIDANATMCQMLGYTREELVGLHASDIVAPSEVPHIAPALTEVDAGSEYHREWQFRRKDRSTFEADVIVTKMPDGNLLAMIRDITARKLAEEALRASEERFRRQYKGVPLPTYSWLLVGDDFVMQDFNDAAAAIAEGDVRTWVGGLASERYADQPEILADLHACVTEQRQIKRELLFRYAGSGRVRELALSYVFVPPRTVMLHSDDITERKQAERQREAMAQSEKLRALGQMASGIAHDLNQSLMLVASFSDLARQALTHDPPNLAEVDELMTTTTQAALDGGETVKRLLQFTRSTPERDSQLVDLGAVIRDAAQLTAPRWRDATQAEGHPISLHMEAAGQVIVRGSSARLRELLTNLIFNAVDALPAGGTIQLRVLAEAGQGIMEIVDSGAGMSAEVQARVFEPFFTTKGDAGTGLGLAMAFGIVEQHGGHIEVRSAPGSGTTFRITIPLADASDASNAGEPSATRPGQMDPQRPLRVLAVDDEPMMTRAVVRMLKSSGHMVSVAASGEEALEKLADQTFDVVVSDMGMGAGMNGWDLAENVRRQWPQVRFLLATGWGAAIDPTEARARGVEAVLSKPYQLVDLTRALARTDGAA